MRSDDLRAFKPYRELVTTLLHELAHNVHGPVPSTAPPSLPPHRALPRVPSLLMASSVSLDRTERSPVCLVPLRPRRCRRPHEAPFWSLFCQLYSMYLGFHRAAAARGECRARLQMARGAKTPV